MLTYEQRLASDSRWALSEGSRHFERQSAVQQSLERIAKRLDEFGISYAVVGAMAMFHHGYRRFTEDVDILVTKEGLIKIHKKLEGLGYVPPFEGSKHLRDAETGVRIEFIVSGQFPGDGKPKPVAFPQPDEVAFERDGIKYLKLPTLVELKLASGLSSVDRMKDLTDVQELIKTLSLPLEYADQMNPFVQPKYRELWMNVHAARKRYMLVWRNKFLTAEAQSLDEMISSITVAAKTLKAMQADGVILDPEGGTADDYAYLVTTDQGVAKKYGMHDESELLLDDSDDEEPAADGR